MFDSRDYYKLPDGKMVPTFGTVARAMFNSVETIEACQAMEDQRRFNAFDRKWLKDFHISL